MTSQEGSWSRRGEIIDIYPVNNELPIRIEFFDNIIDKIREYDPATQRTLDSIDKVEIVQVGFNLLIRKKLENISKDNIFNSEEITNKNNFDRYLGIIEESPSNLINYINENTIIVVDEVDDCNKFANNWYIESVNNFDQYKDEIAHNLISNNINMKVKPNLHKKFESIEETFNEFNVINQGKKVSLADLIVLAGSAGIEKAASDGGHQVRVPFTAGRTDATQDQTDVESFAYLEPRSDAFRNYHEKGVEVKPEEMLLDKAQLLGLTAPEMTVLLGGMRSLGINHSDYGIDPENPNDLDNDFFKTLLDMRVSWKPNGTGNSYEGSDRVSGAKVRTATRPDLVFGSNSQLSALVEVYAANDSKEKFLKDFVNAWDKVMTNDLF